MREAVRWTGAALALCCGCAAGSMMIKGPVEQQCAGYGLRGCAELVDGVLAYMDGDKAGAVHKLKEAAAKNSPEQIRPFAKSVKELVPGEAGKEIAEILSGEIAPRDLAPPPSAVASATPAPGVPPVASSAVVASASQEPATPEEGISVRGDPVGLALAAPVDPTRLVTESIAPLREVVRQPCDIAGKTGACVHRQNGPLVITDAAVPSGCPSELYIGAANSSGALTWLIQANGAPTHGARFFVRADERLTVAVRGANPNSEGDPRCSLTWAGFRPRIVPQVRGTATSH